MGVDNFFDFLGIIGGCSWHVVTSLHVVYVVVAGCGGPNRVVTDGMLKGVCGLHCGSVVDLKLLHRGKPWDRARWRSGAT